jgi:hypothetical protein
MTDEHVRDQQVVWRFLETSKHYLTTNIADEAQFESSRQPKAHALTRPSHKQSTTGRRDRSDTVVWALPRRPRFP